MAPLFSGSSSPLPLCSPVLAPPLLTWSCRWAQDKENSITTEPGTEDEEAGETTADDTEEEAETETLVEAEEVTTGSDHNLDISLKVSSSKQDILMKIFKICLKLHLLS